MGVSPVEKAELWHRRSVVAVAISALVFVSTTFFSVPPPIQIVLIFAVTGSAFWLMITTMWLFTVRSEVTPESAPSEPSANEES